jgi:hypothetical protein
VHENPSSESWQNNVLGSASLHSSQVSRAARHGGDTPSTDIWWHWDRQSSVHSGVAHGIVVPVAHSASQHDTTSPHGALVCVDDEAVAEDVNAAAAPTPLVPAPPSITTLGPQAISSTPARAKIIVRFMGSSS